MKSISYSFYSNQISENISIDSYSQGFCLSSVLPKYNIISPTPPHFCLVLSSEPKIVTARFVDTIEELTVKQMPMYNNSLNYE
ncbi:hypothetical protein ACTXT7_001888 [Hymenolepis weldensis]